MVKEITLQVQSNVIRPKKKRKLKEKVYEEPHYDRNQLNHFLDRVGKMDSQTYVVFRIIAYTGMRQGEVYSLRWYNLDEVNGTLSVKRTVARGKKYQKILQPTKTVAGERVIPLDDETIKLLRKWCKEQREAMLKLGFNTSTLEQHIITNEYNEFQYAQYPYVRLKAVRKKLK